MNEVLNYCLNEIGCALPGFYVREVSNEPVITPLAVAFAGEKVYFSAAKEIFAEAKKHIDEPGALYDLAARYARERGYEPPRADEIICYEVGKCAPSNSAVRLTGAEKDALFSDLPYLVTLGPVFGIVKNGVAVSLAGAVDRGSVYEVHIETGAVRTKKGLCRGVLKIARAYRRKAAFIPMQERKPRVGLDRALRRRSAGPKLPRFYCPSVAEMVSSLSLYDCIA